MAANFSRSRHNIFLEKCTEDVRFKAPESIRDGLAIRAREHGFATVQEFLLYTSYAIVLGPDSVKEQLNHRAEMVANIGKIWGGNE